MNRRTLLKAVTLTVFGLPMPAGAQEALALTDEDRSDLRRVDAYLNSLRTLKSRFVQVAPDGAVSHGIAWMQRPGRMRFQYDAPSPVLLVAGYGLVVFYDRELNQTTNIPLGSTPLGILLRDQLTLTGPDVTITRIDRPPGQIQVTLLRSASPGDGTLTLAFNAAPLQLVSWLVVDSQRRATSVRLYDVELGGSFDQRMFTFINPKFMPNANKDYQ